MMKRGDVPKELRLKRERERERERELAGREAKEGPQQPATYRIGMFENS